MDDVAFVMKKSPPSKTTNCSLSKCWTRYVLFLRARGLSTFLSYPSTLYSFSLTRRSRDARTDCRCQKSWDFLAFYWSLLAR